MSDSKLIVQIAADISQLKSGFSKAQSQTSAFSRNISKLGGLVAGAFSAQKIIEFGKYATDLAGKLQGVEQGFKRIAKPGLLTELRDATRGTVSDLDLMSRAVSASNLGLPIEKLGTYFEFARRRAKETGESVDYLVNSIVTGIGRKSPLILDNLGISATDLRDRIKEVGDFGEAAGDIIEREMAKMGPDVETAAEPTAQMGAAFENLAAAIGKKLTPAMGVTTSGLAAFTQGMADVVDSETLSFWDKFSALLGGPVATAEVMAAARIEKTNKELKAQADFVADTTDGYKDMVGAINDLTLADLRAQIERLNDELENASSSAEYVATMKQIAHYEQLIANITGEETEAVKRLNKAREEQLKLNKLLAVDREAEVQDLEMMNAMTKSFVDNQKAWYADMYDSIMEDFAEWGKQQSEEWERQAEEDARAADQRKAQATEEMKARQAATDSAIAGFGMIAQAMQAAGAKSKAWAILEIAANTAAGISRAVAAGAGIPFPANIGAIAMGMAAVISGIGAANAALSSAPALAQGGLASGPTYAMVGDNPNARFDPEVISPLSKLPAMMDGAGGGYRQIDVRLSYDHLEVILEKINRNKAYRR